MYNLEELNNKVNEMLGRNKELINKNVFFGDNTLNVELLKEYSIEEISNELGKYIIRKEYDKIKELLCLNDKELSDKIKKAFLLSNKFNITSYFYDEVSDFILENYELNKDLFTKYVIGCNREKLLISYAKNAQLDNDDEIIKAVIDMGINSIVSYAIEVPNAPLELFGKELINTQNNDVYELIRFILFVPNIPNNIFNQIMEKIFQINDAKAFIYMLKSDTYQKLICDEIIFNRICDAILSSGRGLLIYDLATSVKNVPMSKIIKVLINNEDIDTLYKLITHDNIFNRAISKNKIEAKLIEEIINLFVKEASIYDIIQINKVFLKEDEILAKLINANNCSEEEISDYVSHSIKRLNPLKTYDLLINTNSIMVLKKLYSVVIKNDQLRKNVVTKIINHENQLSALDFALESSTLPVDRKNIIDNIDLIKLFRIINRKKDNEETVNFKNKELLAICHNNYLEICNFFYASAKYNKKNNTVHDKLLKEFISCSILEKDGILFLQVFYDYLIDPIGNHDKLEELTNEYETQKALLKTDVKEPKENKSLLKKMFKKN